MFFECLVITANNIAGVNDIVGQGEFGFAVDGIHKGLQHRVVAMIMCVGDVNEAEQRF